MNERVMQAIRIGTVAAVGFGFAGAVGRTQGESAPATPQPSPMLDAKCDNTRVVFHNEQPLKHPTIQCPPDPINDPTGKMTQHISFDCGGSNVIFRVFGGSDLEVKSQFDVTIPCAPEGYSEKPGEETYISNDTKECDDGSRYTIVVRDGDVDPTNTFVHPFQGQTEITCDTLSR